MNDINKDRDDIIKNELEAHRILKELVKSKGPEKRMKPTAEMKTLFETLITEYTELFMDLYQPNGGHYNDDTNAEHILKLVKCMNNMVISNIWSGRSEDIAYVLKSLEESLFGEADKFLEELIEFIDANTESYDFYHVTVSKSSDEIRVDTKYTLLGYFVNILTEIHHDFVGSGYDQLSTPAYREMIEPYLVSLSKVSVDVAAKADYFFRSPKSKMIPLDTFLQRVYRKGGGHFSEDMANSIAMHCLKKKDVIIPSNEKNGRFRIKNPQDILDSPIATSPFTMPDSTKFHCDDSDSSQVMDGNPSDFNLPEVITKIDAGSHTRQGHNAYDPNLMSLTSILKKYNIVMNFYIPTVSSSADGGCFKNSMYREEPTIKIHIPNNDRNSTIVVRGTNGKRLISRSIKKSISASTALSLFKITGGAKSIKFPILLTKTIGDTLYAINMHVVDYISQTHSIDGSVIDDYNKILLPGLHTTLVFNSGDYNAIFFSLMDVNFNFDGLSGKRLIDNPTLMFANTKVTRGQLSDRASDEYGHAKSKASVPLNNYTQHMFHVIAAYKKEIESIFYRIHDLVYYSYYKVYKSYVSTYGTENIINDINRYSDYINETDPFEEKDIVLRNDPSTGVPLIYSIFYSRGTITNYDELIIQILQSRCVEFSDVLLNSINPDIKSNIEFIEEEINLKALIYVYLFIDESKSIKSINVVPKRKIENSPGPNESRNLKKARITNNQMNDTQNGGKTKKTRRRRNTYLNRRNSRMRTSIKRERNKK